MRNSSPLHMQFLVNLNGSRTKMEKITNLNVIEMDDNIKYT